MQKSTSTSLRTKKVSIKIIALVLGMAMLVSVAGLSLYFLRSRDGKEPGEANLESNFQTITGKFTDRQITDSESAILAVKDVAVDLGLGNAVEELTPKSTNTVDNLTYYRLQQNYQGIPVYGSTFVVVTDENGEAKGLTGNAAEIDDNISLTPTVTQEQVEASIQSYVGEGIEISIPELSDDMLVIYNFDYMIDGATLAYRVYAHGITFVINAVTAEIISTNAGANSYNASNEDGSVQFDVYYDTKHDTYVLYNQERNIIVSSWNGMHSDDVNLASGREIVEIRMSMGIDYAVESETGIFSDVGAMLYTWGIRVYDYFDQRFGIGSRYDAIYLFYDDGRDDGENAYGGVSEENQRRGYITVGTSYELDATDVLAHEFTHVISGQIVEWDDGESVSTETNQIVTGAINEAISDVFGVIVDAAVKKEEPDWVLTLGNSGRSPQQPESYGDISHVSQITDDMGSHARSTVVSHAAYLMTQSSTGGTALTIDELAELWYNTLFTLPCNCDFDVLRQNMVMTARSLEYTDSQIRCIEHAFDQVGIDGMAENGATAYETYDVDPTLQVYGADMELYGNYTIDIIRRKTETDNDKSQDKHIKVTNTKPVSLTMREGIYTITIRDASNTDLKYTKNIIISADSPEENIIFATDFGKTEAHVHIFEIQSAPATCTEPGWEKKICACGYYELIKELAKLDHNYVGGKCTMCGMAEGGDQPPDSDKPASVGLEFTSNGDGTCAVSGIGTCTDTELVIPSIYNGMSVVGIGRNAFSGNTNITGVVIPNSVAKIDWNAFYQCTALAEIIIPGSVKEIGNRAFAGCTNLKKAVFMDGATSVGLFMFENCSNLKEVILSNTITEIKQGAFRWCGGLTKITLSSNLTTIGELAFQSCRKLTSISLPNGLQTIDEDAFLDCNGLTSIDIPSSVTSIGEGAFKECDNLSAINIDNAYYRSVDGVLYNNDVTKLLCCPSGKSGSVVIPDGVTELGNEAFYYGKVTQITIPKSLVRVGDHAFFQCLSLTDVYYYGTETQWNLIENIDDTYDNQSVYAATIHYLGEDDPTPPVPTTTATIVVDFKEAMLGDTVKVNVNLADNPGLASLVLKVSYDQSLLTLTNVE